MGCVATLRLWAASVRVNDHKKLQSKPMVGIAVLNLRFYVVLELSFSQVHILGNMMCV